MNLKLNIASCRISRQSVFRLRYHAYRHEGAINYSEDETFSDYYDTLQTSLLMYVSDEAGNAVGSLRFSVQPPETPTLQLPPSCPEILVFPEVMEVLKRDRRAIASGSRFAIDPCHRQRGQIALLLLMAEARAAKVAGAKWGVATARGSHLRMYNRFLLREACPARKMPGLNYCYALLVSDIDQDYAETMSRFPASTRDILEAHRDWDDQVRQALSMIRGAERWLPSH